MGTDASAEGRLRDLSDRVRYHQEQAEALRVERDEAIREAIEQGLSAYRVSQVTGLDERGVGRIRDKG